jgi:hypothetical protein
MEVEAKVSQTVQDVSAEPVKKVVRDSVDKNTVEK